jgi:hypothetical protein
LLFNAAHHHAQVARFNHQAHPLRLNGVLDGVSDLAGEPLLHLEAAVRNPDLSRSEESRSHDNDLVSSSRPGPIHAIYFESTSGARVSSIETRIVLMS